MSNSKPVPPDDDEVRKDAVRMIAKAELLTDQIADKLKAIEESQTLDV